MSTSRWMDKERVAYTYNRIFFSPLKLLSYATTGMKLENIVISERSRSQEDTYCLTPLIWGISISQT